METEPPGGLRMRPSVEPHVWYPLTDRDHFHLLRSHHRLLLHLVRHRREHDNQRDVGPVDRFVERFPLDQFAGYDIRFR